MRKVLKKFGLLKYNSSRTFYVYSSKYTRSVKNINRNLLLSNSKTNEKTKQIFEVIKTATENVLLVCFDEERKIYKSSVL